MKKIMYTLMLFAATALTSCSKEDSIGISGDTSPVTINLSTIEAATKTTNITRYILEVYKTSDTNTRILRVEQATGTFTVNLENNVNYTCLFWADEVAPSDNTNGTYDALNLKDVTLNGGKVMEEAFFAKHEITTAVASFGVTLKRATAKVNFFETGTVVANKDLAITFDQYPGFNALTSDATGTAVSITKTFNSAATAGILGTVTTFASVTGINTNFTALYDTQVTNTMPSTPLKANFITNLRGSYAFGNQVFTLIITPEGTWSSIVSGVRINVGTSGTPVWIVVADRNALKGGTNGATPGATSTSADYGYYYQWGNASNDPTNVEKSHRACFDFGEGNGLWRLPTSAEWIKIVGNSGSSHSTDANRKAKWDGTDWKIFDERAGLTANFVNIPMAGYKSGSSGASGTGTDNVGLVAYYLSSTGFDVARLSNSGETYTYTESGSSGFSVRCVRNAE